MVVIIGTLGRHSKKISSKSRDKITWHDITSGIRKTFKASSGSYGVVK